LPDLEQDRDAYVDAVLQLVDTCAIGMVLPAHDGSIEALRRRRNEFTGRCALPLASDRALDLAVSKERTLGLAAALGIPVPASLPVGEPCDLRAALAEVGLPAVLKPVQSWVVDGNGTGTRLTSVLVQDLDEAAKTLAWMRSCGGSVLVQPWLPGGREACSLFYADTRVWARFAQKSHREWPALGGVSVLCESVSLDARIAEWSEALIRAIGLEGCSMVEFRRDREGQPVLMEVNPRMGATAALAVRCGVDFPGLLYAWGTGEELQAVEGYRVGRRVRWLVGDLWYLTSALTAGRSPEVPSRTRALGAVLADFVLRPSHIDVWSWRDPRPALTELYATARECAARGARRWRRR
jgi:predicted ATP-grasp superfamily ATP-dependent carboligase